MISKYAEEDGLVVHETITRNGTTWAIGIADGSWFAYPDAHYALNTGLICAGAFVTQDEARNEVKSWTA